MAAQKSTGLATYIAVTGSIKAALNGSKIYIYSGTVPATVDEALSGPVLLTTIDVSGTGVTFSSTVGTGGVLVKTTSETWTSTVAATGTASFFRMAAADPSTLSTTAVRLQGTVGTSVLNDLVLTSASLTAGNTQNVDQFQIS